MTPRILAISGSLRRESFSTAILRTLGESLGDGVDYRLFHLGGIPLYNQDDDTATPPGEVALLRQAIAEADGIIIASPEFNYGIPGVLKNALDWASRPYARSTLIGKPVLIVTSSPAFTGGVRAQAPLVETLHAIAARPLARAQIVIGLVHEKITGGRLTDAAALAFLKDGVADLLRAAGKPVDMSLERA